MNSIITSTFNLLRAVKNASQIKAKRNFSDFFADRILQAVSRPSLISAIDYLTKQMDARAGYISNQVFVEFIREASRPESFLMLKWMRKHVKITAMIADIRDEVEYHEALKAVDLGDNISEKFSAPKLPDYDIPIKITCLTPLSHGGDVKAGNAVLFRRQTIISEKGAVEDVPFYSGNALRGQLRDLLADHYLESLGLTPNRANPPVELWFFYTLYSGGILEERSQAAKAIEKRLGREGTTNTSEIIHFRNMIPPLSIMGCALGNRVLPGKIFVGDLRPRCSLWGTSNIPLEELFEWNYLTRREDCAANTDNHSMIVNVECLKTGVILDGGVDMMSMVETDKAALGRALILLQKHGRLGGQNARGLGQIKVEIDNIPDPSPYDRYLKEKKEEILQYLIELEAIRADL